MTAPTSPPTLPGPLPVEDLDGLGDLLLRSCDALVVVARPDGLLVSANPAARALLGDGGVEPVVALAGAGGASELLRVIGKVARGGTGLTCSTRVASGDQGRTFAWALSPVPGPGDLVSLVGVDITATTRQLDDLAARTCTDELTGLANRAGLQRALSERAGTGAHLLFCDLNGFKAVNDTHGHGAGDQVLVEVARRFVRAVRGEDLVARLGGDEFVVLAAPSPTASAEGLRRRIAGAVQQPMLLPGGLVVLVGVSIGMAVLERGLDPVEALARADAAMYGAKPSRTSVAAVVRGPR